jgi:deubiquitinating protein VCIP135
MDNHTGKAVPLPDLGKPKIFNCSVLCDKAFRIEPEHINVEGFGRDLSGSHEYLQVIEKNQ